MGWLEKQLAEEEGARSIIDENIKYIRRDHILKQIRRWVMFFMRQISWIKSQKCRLRIFKKKCFYFQPCSSQSWSCNGFHRAHDSAHLPHTESGGGAHSVHYGDVVLVLVVGRLCASVGCVRRADRGGANVMALGSCQVTDESLAVILTESWIILVRTFCLTSCSL